MASQSFCSIDLCLEVFLCKEGVFGNLISSIWKRKIMEKDGAKILF